MLKLVAILLVLGVSFTSSVLAAPFDPDIDGADRTRVLVLASPHLSQTKGITTAHLEPLLDCLVRFSPTQIAIESMSPRTLQAMICSRGVYDAVIEQFAHDQVAVADAMQSHYEIDAHESSKLLAEGIEDPLRRIGHLLAAYEFYSALLQWSSLPGDVRERAALPDTVKETLNTSLASGNESILIGVALARQLGHVAIHAMDDHLDKDDYLAMIGRLGEELAESQVLDSVMSHPHFAEIKTRLTDAVAAGNLLPFYEWVNSEAYGTLDAQLQWGCWFDMKLGSRLDRTRVALWEVRNLNMVSHIRRLTGEDPGGRVLVIVGAGHKPFFDDYLARMSDLKLVELSDFK